MQGCRDAAMQECSTATRGAWGVRGMGTTSVRLSAGVWKAAKVRAGREGGAVQAGAEAALRAWVERPGPASEPTGDRREAGTAARPRAAEGPGGPPRASGPGAGGGGAGGAGVGAGSDGEAGGVGAAGVKFRVIRPIGAARLDVEIEDRDDKTGLAKALFFSEPDGDRK